MNNKALYESIMKNVAKEIKKALLEKENNTWRNVSNTTFIYHGDWSDPEVKLKDKHGTYLINYYDLENFLRDYLTEGGRDHSFDGCYDEYIDSLDSDIISSILDEYICCMEIKSEEEKYKDEEDDEEN